MTKTHADVVPPCPHAQGQHGHAFLGDQHASNQRRTLAVVALTLVTMVVEIGAGWWSGSMALLADGWHMASHAVALGVAAFAYRYARKHADNRRYSFGTGKVGDLAAFASALLLAVVALLMAWESGLRLLNPQSVSYGEALWVAVLGLLVNLASAALLHQGGHDHGHAHGHDHDHEHAHDGHHEHEHHDHDEHEHEHEHEHDEHAHGSHAAHDSHADHNLRSAYIHVIADALTSVLAIAALLAGRYLGWAWLDPAVGLLGAFVIARWALGLGKQTAAVLLDASVDPALAARVRSALEQGDTQIDDLHLWRLAPGKFAVIAALRSAKPLSAADYKSRLAGLPQLVHVTVEVADR